MNISYFEKTFILLSFIAILTIYSCRNDNRFLTLDTCLVNIDKLKETNIRRLECIDYWEFERNDYKVISSDSNYYEFSTVQGLLLKSTDSSRIHQFTNKEISAQVRYIIDSLKIVSLSSDPDTRIFKAEFLMENINVEKLWKICFEEKNDETIDNMAGQISYGCAVNRYSKFLYVTSDRSQVNRNCYRFFKYKNYYFQICGVETTDKDTGADK